MIVAHNYQNKIFVRRNSLGTAIAELPLVMWIIFIGIGMPLLSLVLLTVRYSLFLEAARQAADVACSAQTYTSMSGSTATPAINLAQDTAVSVASSFSGITVSPSDVNCSIIVTPLNSGASVTMPANQPLTSRPDPSENLYQIEVDVTGQIQPVLSMPIPEFFNIPGLSAPLTTSTSMIRVFQNPPGLYGGGSTGNGQNGNNPSGSTGNTPGSGPSAGFG